MRHLRYALLGLLALGAVLLSRGSLAGPRNPPQAVAQGQTDIVVEAVVNCISGPPITCEQHPLAGEYGVILAHELYDKIIRVSLAPGATSATFDVFWECSRDVTDADLDGFNDCRTVEPKPNHPKDHTDLQHVDHRLRDYGISNPDTQRCIDSPSPGVPVRAEFDGEIMGSGFVDTASPDCFYVVKLLAPRCTDAFNPDTDPSGDLVTADCHHVDRLGTGRPQDVDIFADLGDRFVARSATGGEGGVDLIARTAQDLAITPVVCQSGFTQCQEDPTGGDFGTLNPGQPATKVIEVTLRPYFLEEGVFDTVLFDLLWECPRDVTDADADGFNDCRDISPGSPNHPKDAGDPLHIDGHLRDDVAVSTPDQGQCLDAFSQFPANMPAEVEVERIGPGVVSLTVPSCFYELSFTAPVCSGGCTLGDDIVVQLTGHAISPEPSARLQIDPVPTTNEDFGCAGSVIALNLAVGVSVPSPWDNSVQCFVSSPPQPAIFLIPGAGGDCEEMTQLEDWLQNTKGLSGRVECFKASDPPCYGTQVSSQQLQAKVEDFGLRMGVDKVYLVGYSYGGIVARWYIEEMGGSVNVEALVMVGTPNQGIKAADFWSSAPFVKVSCNSIFMESNRVWEDLHPDSAVLNALNGDWTGPPIPYWSIAGTADNSLIIKRWPPFIGTQAANDCLVKVSDVELSGVTLETDGSEPEADRDRHSDAWYCNGLLLRNKLRLMEDEAWVFPRIWDGLGLGAGASAAVAAQAPSVASPSPGSNDLRPLAGFFVGSVSPSSQSVHQVDIDSQVGEVFFTLVWPEDAGVPALQLAVQRRDASIVQPTDPGVEHGPPQSPAPGGIASEEWRVLNPPTGTWALTVAAGDGSVDADYTLLAFVETDVTFTLDSDRASYVVSDTAVLTAVLAQETTPLSGGTVTADVQRPDATSVALTLFDDGMHGDGAADDGVYGNDLLLDECGTYFVNASADIVLTEAIHREMAIGVMVTVEGDATLDPCVADEDGDGWVDAEDNCALVPTAWWVPANDPDCDGFSTADENSIGTDPNLACSTDRWPPDFNSDHIVDIFDLNLLKPVFFSTGPARFDLVPDSSIDIFDVNRFKPFFFLSCTP